jgi:exopolyphosphatase/guanosine-5'-triphosphate,3'-diphosphate pyrophosphatase
MKRAVIDIGTNSTILMIGWMTDNGTVHCDLQKFAVTRLGKGMANTGMISRESMQRTFDVLDEYKTIIDKANIGKVHLVGTDALRSATNNVVFEDLILKNYGWKIDIIPAIDEANFSFLGALETNTPLVNPVMVVDVGGGSTEIIIGSEKNILVTDSLPLGVVRIGESTGMDSQLTSEKINLINQQIATVLAASSIDFENQNIGSLIGVGGTITTLVAIKEKMTQYDPEKVNGYRLNMATLEHIFGYLNSMSIEERRQLPGIVPGREDVILYGTLIFRTIMELMEISEVIASDRGLRFGYLKYLEKK